MGLKRTLAGAVGAAVVLAMTACVAESEETGVEPDEVPVQQQTPDGQEQTPDEQEPADDGQGDEPTEAAEEGAGALGALLKCEDEATLAATEEIRTREGLDVLFGDSVDAATNCLWGMEGDSNSLGINLQYWTLGGDVPDQDMLDLFTLERIEAPELEARGFVVAHEGEGRDTVWAFGHGFQVWATPDRLEVTQDELIQLTVSLVEEMA